MISVNDIPSGEFELSMLMGLCMSIGFLTMLLISGNILLYGSEVKSIRLIFFNVFLLGGLWLNFNKIKGYSSIIKGYIEK